MHPTNIDDLTACGVAPDVVAALKAHYGCALLPMQQEVLGETGLLSGESLLVSAPTASGKTLLAELAMLRAAGRSMIAVYLAPTRALAEELSAGFAARWGALGLRIACTTSELRGDDADIAAGRVAIVVGVYEKIAGLLSRHPGLWARIGVLVADELQLVGEPGRGAAVDALLTAWKLRQPRPQLVALSAVLPEVERAAAWLEVPLVRSGARPAPLREGVLDTECGRFRWRDSTKREPGEETIESLRLAPGESGEAGDGVLAALRLAGDGEKSVLHFCATRGEAWQLARAAAEISSLAPAADALDSLALHEPEAVRSRLEPLLERGVGVHCADMPPCLRRIVERAFASRELRLLFATSTLAQGVNLLCDVVMHSPLMVATDPCLGQPVLVPVTRERLANQGGRAGRRAGAVGLSMVVARGEPAARRAWDALVSARPAALRSALASESWSRFIAQRVCVARETSVRELSRFLGATLAAGAMPEAELTRRLEGEIADGLRAGLWSRSAAGAIVATALGEVHATTGITVATLHGWGELLRAGVAPSRAGAVLLVALAGEWDAMPLRVRAEDRRRSTWIRAIVARLPAEGAGFDGLLCDPAGAPVAVHEAARRALVLLDWLDGTTRESIEESHGLLAQHVADMAARAAWLASGAADIAGACGAAEMLPHFESIATGAERAIAPAATPATPEPVPAAPTADSAAPVLRFLDPAMGLVEFASRRVALTPTQYRLLHVLAERPLTGVSYRELHDRVWDDAVVEQQMIGFHRRRLETVLLGRAPEGKHGELIRTRPRWGLYLDLDPARIVTAA